ncbi:MAG TPA: GAF domain-containing protein [Chitinophagaceae bacterium]|jgi:PAS domain-containing protein|nr:GAF domain-containing protein [Chitinophagaceae bacterium]
MITPETPTNEQERLKALYEYDILDTLPEKDFDYLTTIASQICDTPISLITLIDSSRQWFKSHHGLSIEETDKKYSFCAHAINMPYKMMVVPDARYDERFADNPFVTDEPKVVFYAGVPLVTEKGHALGTLCIIDKKPRTLSNKQNEALHALSNQVVKLLELRKNNKELSEIKEALEKSIDQYTQISKVAQVGGWEFDLLKNKFNWTSITKEIHEVPPEFVPDLRSAINFYKEGEDRRKMMLLFSKAMDHGESFDVESKIITAKGNERWVRTKAEAKRANGIYIRVYGILQDITDHMMQNNDPAKIN